MEYLLALEQVQLKLFITDATKSETAMARRFRPLNKLFFKFYRRYLLKSRARRKVDLSQLVSKTAVLRCKTLNGEYYNQADVKTIRGFDLDFILSFRFGTIRGEILNAARYGIWSFHHGDGERCRGNPAFWEIYNGDNVAGATLQRLTEPPDAGIVLKKGFFGTVRYSYAKNLDTICFESARWPAQVCTDIVNGAASYLNASPSKTNAPLSHCPSNRQFLVFVVRLFRNALVEEYRILFRHEQWNIGIVSRPINFFVNPQGKPEIHWMPARQKGKFLADPFGVIKDGKPYVFCEDFDYRTFRGCVSKIELPWNNHFHPEKAITLPIHTSYPYLVEHEGAIYCIPETCAAREIVIYKAEEFPDKWTKVASLVKNFSGVDPTVFRHHGSWWLTSVAEGTNNLFIWHAMDLLGPWKPHTANPVKTDVRSAQPAGTPFTHDGFLIRPAQDNSRTYGGRIVLNRVTRLTPTEFAEEPIGTIEPDQSGPRPDGVHTVAALGEITLIDGKRLIFVSSGFKQALSRQLRRIVRWH